jgi:hypothetical protein
MWMFWAFKLSFDVDNTVFLGHFFQKLGEIGFNFLVTLIVEVFFFFFAKLPATVTQDQWPVL